MTTNDRPRRRLRVSVASLAAALPLCWAPPTDAQENAAEVLEIIRSLAPRAGRTEVPRYIAEGVGFEFDSDRLTATARVKLDRLDRALHSPALASLRFRVEGHTDSRGSARYNQELSERRARTVAAYLAGAQDIAFARIAGHGEDRPRDPLNPESGVNRRVEIVTLGPPGAADAGDSSESFVEGVLTGGRR